RYIFGKRHYNARIEKCHSVGDGTNSLRSKCYFGFGISEMWDDNTALEYLVKLVRVGGERNGDSPFSAPISAHLGSKILFRFAKLTRPNGFISIVWSLKDDIMSENFGKCSVFAFLNGAFVATIRRKLKEPRPPTRSQPHRCALEVYSQERSTRHVFLPLMEHRYEKIAVECGVLYITEVDNFPLVDAFFFVESSPMTLVGLRMTTADGHHPTASTVGQFTEHVAAYFNAWEELFRDMSWEMIYVQHADSMLMAGWQGRGVVSSDNVSEEEEQRIAAFWKEKVRQQQVSVSSEAASRGAALRSGEHLQKWENKLGNERGI
ncbi:retrotransposon hot spot (RHS) protein, putative, partial [Trypanosoma cruzi marinkellei]